MMAEEALHQLYDTTPLLGGIRRRAAIRILAAMPELDGVLTLAAALSKGHPNAAYIGNILGHLSPNLDGEQIAALWRTWEADPGPVLGAVLARLGWPREQPIDRKLACNLLALATVQTPPDVLRAVVRFAHALPEHDEVLNDAIYGAWVRSQSKELEQLIGEQGRQPGNPALEALHALVTGQLSRYTNLDDADDELLTHAFTVAPQPFRDRMVRTIAASADRQLKERYRNVLLQAGVDSAQSIAYLKLLGDEDGLFEQARTMRLDQVLELCERWTVQADRSTCPSQRPVLEHALAAYQHLETTQGTADPSLPDGLMDLFTYWRSERSKSPKGSTEDPISRARRFYLDHVRGRIEAPRLTAGTHSEHWLERLVARLADATDLAETQADPVCWVSACAGDAALLQTPISGTPEDYSRHNRLLSQATSRIAAHTLGLLMILCAFQGVFVGNGISVEEIGEATERTAIEVEESDDFIFSAER